MRFWLLAQAVTALLAWDLDPTHAGVPFEAEVNGVVGTCDVQTTATDRRCGVTVLPGTHTFRVHPVGGPWSDPLTASIGGGQPGAPPGAFTLVRFFEVSPPAHPLSLAPTSVTFSLTAPQTAVPGSRSFVVTTQAGRVWETHDAMPGIDISPQTKCPGNGAGDGVRCTGTQTVVLTPSAQILALPVGTHGYQVRLTTAGAPDVILAVTVTVTP